MTRLSQCVALTVALAWDCSAGALTLPPAPDGYAWHECPEFKGALLVPAGWHFRSVNQDGKVAYFVTKNEFVPPGQYEVGISVNVLRGIPSRLGVKPSEFAAQYVQEAHQTRPTERRWRTALGPFVAFGVVYTENLPTPAKFYNLVIANDKTGTAFLVILEAPMTSWAKEWAVVEPVIQRLLIDDTI